MKKFALAGLFALAFWAVPSPAHAWEFEISTFSYYDCTCCCNNGGRKVAPCNSEWFTIWPADAPRQIPGPQVFPYWPAPGSQPRQTQYVPQRPVPVQPVSYYAPSYWYGR